MYLAIDVGNTNIHLGLFAQTKSNFPRLIESFTLPVNQKHLSKLFNYINKQKPITGIIMSDAYSTTALANNRAIQSLKTNLEKFILLRPDMNCGLKFRYFPRTSLGTDRLADCVAAYKIYKRDCLIVDFGTATTFNIVSKNGYFHGGIIIPGIKNLIRALPAHLTDKLPIPVTNSSNKTFACSTQQAVKSGLYQTINGICYNIKKEMQKKLKTKPYTIATGNGLKLMPGIKNIFDKIDPNLTLKGLAIIYQIKYNK
ncbi:MAG: type III pantothenate kinase [Candidatus Latescibacteria bacterium]|nr:type III pantothenate kinase [Candidatus Latescibacterota bacterium]